MQCLLPSAGQHTREVLLSVTQLYFSEGDSTLIHLFFSEANMIFFTANSNSFCNTLCMEINILGGTEGAKTIQNLLSAAQLVSEQDFTHTNI